MKWKRRIRYQKYRLSRRGGRLRLGGAGTFLATSRFFNFFGRADGRGRRRLRTCCALGACRRCDHESHLQERTVAHTEACSQLLELAWRPVSVSLFLPLASLRGQTPSTSASLNVHDGVKRRILRRPTAKNTRRVTSLPSLRAV